MKRVIERISNTFLKEALASPGMLEDLAAMEKYMSESYDGRTFVELLQNADDANAKRVKVFLSGNTLIIANDGRPFDEKDITAICRSGASSKQRGSNIGYRGVGFKSATTISNEIVIYSNDVFFTFSKALCAKALKKSNESVPTVRIPFLYDGNCLDSKANEIIDIMKREGYTTFFIFVKANVQKFIGELEEFDAGWLLFLRNLSHVDICCDLIKRSSIVQRNWLSDTDCVMKILGSNNQWYIITKNNVSIAFKYDPLKGIVPCDSEEGVFHCFLPTMDKTGFPFKVNADFSTDPSRKHIIMDEISKGVLEQIHRLYADVVVRVIKDEEKKLYAVLSLLCTHVTLNSIVSVLENGILEKLRISAWVKVNSGQYIRPLSVEVLPKWMNATERHDLITNISGFATNVVSEDIFESIDKIELLLVKLGAKEKNIIDFENILKSYDCVVDINPKTLGKLFAKCFRARLSDKEMIGTYYVPTDSGLVRLDNSTDNIILDAFFIDAIKETLNTKELETMSIQFSVFSSLLLQKKNRKSVLTRESRLGSVSQQSKLAITKWKTPIQNCMTIESFNGNTPKDVSKKNEEYCISSVDQSGTIRYITVKTVSIIGDSFSLTENEYFAAQRLKNDYYVYLFTTNTDSIEYEVIQNPVANLHMKKLVKEWEWRCALYDLNIDLEKESIPESDYSRESFLNVNFDKLDGESFERFCAQLLIKNGYEDVSITKGSGDQGIDIIAYRDTIKYGIQCKCYSADIGNGSVQEVYAGKTFYRCNVGIVLTNRYFTPSAIELAQSNGIALWNREVLLKLIRNVSD